MPEIPAPTAEELANEEARLWDSRNFYVSGTTFNFCNSQQLSVAVTKMQGLTNSLRVSITLICGMLHVIVRYMAHLEEGGDLDWDVRNIMTAITTCNKNIPWHQGMEKW
jgi:hypothetical protein